MSCKFQAEKSEREDCQLNLLADCANLKFSAHLEKTSCFPLFRPKVSLFTYFFNVEKRIESLYFDLQFRKSRSDPAEALKQSLFTPL
jgi:hypothetical protein